MATPGTPQLFHGLPSAKHSSTALAPLYWRKQLGNLWALETQQNIAFIEQACPTGQGQGTAYFLL